MASSLIGHGEPLLRPEESTQLDYEVELLDGVLEEGQERDFRIKLPDAKKVMITTEDNTQTELQKVDRNLSISVYPFRMWMK